MRYKFRAWDTETKEMSYDFLSKNWLRVCVESPYVELMQWTGLNDSKGVPIYEGDIVKYTSKERTGTKVSYKRRGYDTYAINSDIEIIGFIKFDLNDNLMTFIVDTKQVTRYESYFWGEGKRSDRPDMATNLLVKPLSTKREYEIIGNIYEHPELINS